MRALYALAVAAASLTACSDPPSGSGSDAETVRPPDSDIQVIVPSEECGATVDCDATAASHPCHTVSCVAGQCVISDTVDEAACDDGNPCTTDGCDPRFGCVYTFNQLPCDDGDPCTFGDRCAAGACVGAPLDCEDDNPCTDDRCDPTLGCVNPPRLGACDDGDACTIDDACVDGRCVPGAPAVCGDPGDPCAASSCDPVAGCIVTLVSGACDDGDACTEGDTCVEGVCRGALAVCDDGNPCTDDYCSPSAGCVAVDNVLPCDDGDPCTLGDTCAGGICLPGAANPLCCADDDACDDGDPCTTDRCEHGMCVLAPLDCDDGSPCTLDRCELGACVHTPWGPISPGPLVVADFEAPDALDRWQHASTNARVAWRRDTSQARSGGASLYCGAVPEYSYDFGATVATATLVLAVPPGDQVTLALWAHADLDESGSCIYDALRISLDDAPQAAVCASLTDFTELAFDVTPWAGRLATLTLTFDTVDDQANAGAGVWIDDITLTVAGAPLCDDDTF